LSPAERQKAVIDGKKQLVEQHRAKLADPEFANVRGLVELSSPPERPAPRNARPPNRPTDHLFRVALIRCLIGGKRASKAYCVDAIRPVMTNCTNFGSGMVNCTSY